MCSIASSMNAELFEESVNPFRRRSSRLGKVGNQPWETKEGGRWSTPALDRTTSSMASESRSDVA